MTPKEKAEELVEKMNQPYRPGKAYLMTFYQRKQCALIAVDELLNSRPVMPSPQSCDNLDDCIHQAKEYWNEVKQEIEKL